MEYLGTEEDIFSIKYNKESNTIEFGEKRKDKLFAKIKRHKIMSTIIILTITTSIINLGFIYQFFKILTQI